MARYAKLFSMGGGAGNGTLQLENNQLMDSTLRFVTDNLNTKSVLRLSTISVTNYGAGNISTNTVFRSEEHTSELQSH